MLETLKFGKGNWANKTDSTLAYSDQYGNFQAIPFDFTRATTATRVNKQGLIESVNDGIARIDYSDSTQGALLLEPERTNLIPYSEDLSDSSWSKLNNGTGLTPLVTENFAISPDGTQNADRVVFDISGGTSSSDYSQIQFIVGLKTGNYTNSVYMKSNTSESYEVVLSNPLGGHTKHTVTTEWSRFDATTLGLSSQATSLRIRLRANELTSQYADVSVWGAQFEQSSYPTSYIPTDGAIATRNQEICKNATPVINSEEGVLYAEISALVDDAPHRWISLSDATTNNRVNFQYYTGSNEIRVEVRSEGVTSLNSFIIVTDITDFIKIGVKWKLNDFAVWINGVEVATSNTGNAPIGMSTLSFTHYGQSANPFFGNTKDLKIYNTALTDAQLQTLTTI